MGKITNVILNSVNKTSGTVTNDFTYYVDWSAILKKDTKYKLKFNYMSGYNYINSFRFPFIRTNILTTNITLNTSTSYNLGNLKYIMSISFKPLADRVLVEPSPAEEKTASGLIIPDTAKEKPLHGTVIAVGDGKKDEPMTLTPGNKVMYGQYSGTEIKLDGKKLLIMKEADIYGVIE